MEEERKRDTPVFHVSAAEIVAATQRQVKPGIERVQALADISRWPYDVIASKTEHRLQIRQIVHKQRALPITAPNNYILVRAEVWECGEGESDTDRQTHCRRPWPLYFASSTTHAKCSDHVRWKPNSITLSGSNHLRTSSEPAPNQTA